MMIGFDKLDKWKEGGRVREETLNYIKVLWSSINSLQVFSSLSLLFSFFIGELARILDIVRMKKLEEK